MKIILIQLKLIYLKKEYTATLCRYKSIPEGSTPIDFAYEVHTELGNEVNSALINGQIVPLNATISNGDSVEIIKSKSPQGPRLEWLNTDLGL